MQTEELVELVRNVQALRTESQRIELKAAEKGCPTRLYDTLSAFSNQDGGGVILFGVDEVNGYRVCGVYDAQDLQRKVAEQCQQMEPLVRALFSVCEIDGRVVVSAEIPEVDVTERPVFYKGVGRVRGSYVRVGEADEPMSEYEIYSYEAFRKRIRDDLRVVEGASFVLKDESRMSRYLESVKRDRLQAQENLADDLVMRLMGVLSENGVPTLAGLLVFSKYPQAVFPQLCITAVSLPGTMMGTVGDDGERFIDNKRITGSLPDMLDEAVEFVRRNSRTKTIIDETGHRADKPEYPIIAVREAVLNALVHRDYSIHTENTPIRIEMYRDRLEIVNCGGLYGKITIDALGVVRPDTRNAALANMLEVLGITENRYSGIPTIRNACARAGLPAPVFTSQRGEFRVVFKNGLFQLASATGNALVDFCATPRSRKEITAFVGKSKNHVVSQILAPLVAQGVLRLTLPDKPRSKNQRYVKV